MLELVNRDLYNARPSSSVESRRSFAAVRLTSFFRLQAAGHRLPYPLVPVLRSGDDSLQLRCTKPLHPNLNIFDQIQCLRCPPQIYSILRTNLSIRRRIWNGHIPRVSFHFTPPATNMLPPLGQLLRPVCMLQL